MNKQIFTRPGFTLIETIVYIGITVMVIVASVHVMLATMGAREKTEIVSAVQQDLRFAMDRIANAILDARDIDTSGSTFGNDSGVLSLTMSGSSAALDPTVFTLSGSRIYIQEGAGVAFPITSPTILVDQLRFTNLSAIDSYGTVKVRIHATDAYAGSDKTYEDKMTLETSVSLRQ